MNIRLNGKNYEVDASVVHLTQLVESLGIAHKMIIIEHNRQVLEKNDWSQIMLQDGDQIEIVHFVGGG